MKRLAVSLSIYGLLICLLPFNMFAGNEQRAGQAGASQLLLNPWARSSGLGNSNVASVNGLESVQINVAGTAFTNQTELLFARTNWFKSSGININAFGLTQKVSETGAFSLSVTSLDFGNIQITTVDLPEGGLGNFHPQYTTIALSYANAFSNSIYGGMSVKVVNEAISDLTASGIALDAGIIYVTGIGKYKNDEKKTDNFRFGITLKNVGPTMKYRGDGLSFRGTNEGSDIGRTVEERSADYELPSCLEMGVSYDIPVITKTDAESKEVKADQLLRLSTTFTSNSFTNDRFHFGLEYNIKNILLIRGGYSYEKGSDNIETRVISLTGPACGASIQIPLNDNGSIFSLDYSYRATENFDGCHSIGAKISL